MTLPVSISQTRMGSQFNLPRPAIGSYSPGDGSRSAMPDRECRSGMNADRIGVPVCAARRLSVAIYNRDLTLGGVQRHILTLARTLQASGWKVTLVLHELSGAFCHAVPAGVEVVDLASRRTLQDIPRLARFLRRVRPDVLVSNLDHNNVAALLASQLAGTRTPVVICQHNALSPEYTRDLSRSYRYIPSLYRLLSRYIAAAVCVSDGVADEMRRIARIPADRDSCDPQRHHRSPAHDSGQRGGCTSLV